MEHLHSRTTTNNGTTFNQQQSSSQQWQSKSSQGSSSNSGSSNSRDYSYYAYLEESINNKAQKLTVEYLKSRGGNALPL